MTVEQTVLTLPPYPRGYHLITEVVERQLSSAARVNRGIAHIMIMHTSAGLTLNENADPDVRDDFRTIFDQLVPDGDSRYIHTIEGTDDMAAHLKSTITGASVTVPMRDGRFFLGQWQGLYLCEFRNQGGPRRIAITILGE